MNFVFHRAKLAANLKAGYKLLGDDKHWQEVTAVRITQEPLRAYNMTVADYHTYFIKGVEGDDGVWVHNDCDRGGTPPPNLTPVAANRAGAFNQAKRDAGVPVSAQPTRTGPNLDRNGNVQPGLRYEYDVPKPGGGVTTVIIRDDSKGHVFLDNPSQNRGPHFNTPNGGHYDY